MTEPTLLLLHGFPTWSYDHAEMASDLARDQAKPVQIDDPVSGRHVLELAVKIMPDAVVTELAGVGHFPSSEAPQAVAAAVRMHR